MFNQSNAFRDDARQQYRCLNGSVDPKFEKVCGDWRDALDNTTTERHLQLAFEAVMGFTETGSLLEAGG